MIPSDTKQSTDGGAKGPAEQLWLTCAQTCLIFMTLVLFRF